MDLDDETVERIARRVAALLRQQPSAPTSQEPAGPVRLVDAATLARRLGVRREWIYRHAHQLGALRLGSDGGRLRFDLDAILQRDQAPPDTRGAQRQEGPGKSGLGFPSRTAYSRVATARSGRAALQRPRPDTGNRKHPMHPNRSAGGG